MKPDRKRNDTLIYAFAASLVIHLLFIITHIDIAKTTSGLAKKTNRIRIVLVDKPKKTVEIKSEIKKQIVNSEQDGRKEREESSKFLGKTDQSYDRQTVSRITGSFKTSGKGEVNGQKDSVQQKEMIQPRVSKRIDKRSKDKGKLSLSDFAIADLKGAQVVKKNLVSSIKRGLKNGELSKLGLSENNDFVDDIPLGDVTHLNTVEYKYFGFYDRIRKKLEQYWGNSLREKADELFKQGRRLPAGVNKITSLVVIIDKGGNIVDVLVKSTSGVNELDEAAIESFNKAGPFPNPPIDLVKSGHAKIEWGFVVKS